MEYIDKLRESIKNNSNISEEFKCNLGILTDTIVTVLPDYDYSKLEGILSSLKLSVDDNLESYSSYDKESNTIKINTNRVFEDRIDLQHLFLNELLLQNSSMNDPALIGLNNGITEAISTTMNSDDSMVKLNPLEYTLVSILSKIVDGKTMIDAYMKGDITNIAMELESIGISNEEVIKLFGDFNKVNTEPSSFVDIELSMIDMYNKKVNYELSNSLITYDDIGSRYDEFSDMLVFKRSELDYLYPHHNFSYLTGFEKVKESLDKAILNTEEVKSNDLVK